jgi:hypothetical protein
MKQTGGNSMTLPPSLPPQQPSPILEYGTNRRDLREIALRQKVILLCILVYILAIFGQYAIPKEFRIFLALPVLGVLIVADVFVFLLATKIYGTALGIVLGILTLIPCVGLITLLIVNSKATALLRAGGLKVGLLGASVPD